MSNSRQYGKRADAALRMWVKLARAFATLSRCSADNIRSYGLTPSQFAVLEALGHLGAMSLGDLAHKMLLSGGNMTIIVDNLEKEGLVQRSADAHDRRVVIAQLTGRGEKLFREIFPGHALAMADLASVLTEKEQARLSVLLKKLGRGVEDRRAQQRHVA